MWILGTEDHGGTEVKIMLDFSVDFGNRGDEDHGGTEVRIMFD